MVIDGVIDTTTVSGALQMMQVCITPLNKNTEN
jgi:hypothetical protein